MTKPLTELGEWKVGQEVIVIGGSILETRTIAKIEKISDGWGGTIFVDKSKFDRHGHERSSGYHGKHLRPATEEAKQEVYGLRARNRLERFKWHSLEPAKALEIYELLKDKLKVE